MPRTQDEIVARITAAAEDDWAGFRREVLLPCLDWDHVQPFLREGHNLIEHEWVTDPNHSPDPQVLEGSARGYLDLAIGKIENHRGISAGRSVEKLTEFAWLLGRDDVVAAVEAADYPQYGAPKVKAFADGMGWSWSASVDLARMAEGLPCRPGCMDGCGQ